jgi:serine/threonine protein kinase
MNHPEQILRTLDHHLVQPTQLILYGRAALALGFPNPPPEFNATMDVDAILPEVKMSSIEADDSFWNAIEKTNEELHPTGLYLTHLFTDAQVILQPDWLENLSPIKFPDLRFLKLFRPSTADLILTKMMRIDPQDRSDIEFLLKHLHPDIREIDHLLQSARIPEIPEIHQAFLDNSTWLKQQIAK